MADSRCNSPATRIGAFAAALLGWGICLTLLARAVLVSRGMPEQATHLYSGWCAECKETLPNPISWQAGFPLAGWGIVYFAAIGFLLAFPGARAVQAAFFLAAAGNGASIVLSAILFRGSAPFCPLCLLVHGLNLVPFACTWSLVAQRGIASDGMRPGGSFRPVQVLTAMLAVIAGGSLQAAVFDGPRLARRTTSQRQPGPGCLQVLAAYQSLPRLALPADPSDRPLGAPRGVTLVVFSSFQCPYCKVFTQMSEHLKSHFGEDLTIVFKHYPLSTACNEAVEVNVQPRACEAAWAAEAAARQGAFWKYHDALFASDLLVRDDTLEAIARAAGLDVARWKADRLDPEVRRKVFRTPGSGTSQASMARLRFSSTVAGFRT